MLSFSRQVLRFSRRPLGVTLRKCLATEAAEGGPAMALTFGSPSESFYHNVSVKQVDVSTSTGSFGILPDHVPTLQTIRPGILTVYEGGSTTKYFVSSGTVTVNNDSTVQILAEEAHPLDRFDEQLVNKQLEQAQQELSSASSEEDKAKATIAVECAEALLKALH
ncbi:ATP synthase subunit delta, mitochondrial [Exaiptasia diaphana]|uniref:ATP synthase F(1) complex subunit delta, mitochondrial n=1 Tax=Exaiptasia diaphana TaxID=2652724 RepID=A0A913WY29_EXADI|nr:ATP synthase subunit delta, mitochondrial [Exaiptasia diaphana]KXJ20855.1 ATP synthase subunit delta, mitochondrial [Exaiptasia diaphana]